MCCWVAPNIAQWLVVVIKSLGPDQVQFAQYMGQQLICPNSIAIDTIQD
jgi:hypothetical protein